MVGFAVSKSVVRRMREPVTVTSSSVSVPASLDAAGCSWAKATPERLTDRATARPTFFLLRSATRTAWRTEVIKLPSIETDWPMVPTEAGTKMCLRVTSKPPTTK